MKRLIALCCGLFVCFLSAQATIYYVATTGNDANIGSISAPFLTIQRAQTSVSAGDTVYVRGGTYAMQTSQVSTYNSIWAYVTYLTKSGTTNNRIKYWNYPGEKPVFNYTAVNPSGFRINAFQVNASWIHLKGLEVVGVQVNITTHTQSECFENQGSNNIYENLSMHDGKAIGFYLTKGGNNLILNCDAYNNWDNVSENQLGGNTDGFGFHPNNDNVGYTNNIFRGCRAWFNSDDGFDCINAFESVRFENCWAFYNGYSTSFASLGDGNGFKAGGYGVSTTPSVPAAIPRNTIVNCLAVRNKANGFYANHHLGGNNWFNNSAYLNAVNYNMLNRSADYTADVNGYAHEMKNNLGWGARSAEYSNIDFTLCNADTNYFNLAVTINAADFLSIDQALLTAARQADGSLPINNFMRLVNGSDAIDKGRDIGLPFYGAAPDLGCFESNYVLPMQLAYFKASVKQMQVQLNWQTTDSRSCNYWLIERTTEPAAPNQWKTVTQINATNALAYAATDIVTNAGTYFYRLKQVDKDGSISYSNILTVVIGKQQIAAHVFPNPLQQQSVLQYALPEDTHVCIQLCDAEGRRITTLSNEQQYKGNKYLSLATTQNLVAGNYWITIATTSSQTLVPLVKQ